MSVFSRNHKGTIDCENEKRMKKWKHKSETDGKAECRLRFGSHKAQNTLFDWFEKNVYFSLDLF